MVQTWVENNEASGGDTVKLGLENLEDKLDTIRSQFGGSVFPTDADRVEGQLCWRTSGGSRGVGMYVLETRVEGTPASDVWKFAFSDSELTAYGESLQVAADAAAARTLLGLGTAATLVSGTGAGEVQTNTQNEGDYLQISNNLSDLADVAAARGVSGLGLGALATLASVGTAQITADAVTRTELVNIEKSMTYVAKAGTHIALSMEHVTATVGSSFTITLTTPTIAGEKISIYCKSVTAGQVLTIDGNGTNILGGDTDELKMYATDDHVQLAYDGSQWVPETLHLIPHVCSLSDDLFTLPNSNSWNNVTLDTINVDTAGMENVASNAIDIKRSGNYRVTMMGAFGQVGPYFMFLRVLKDTVRLTPQILEENVGDYIPSGETDETLFHIEFSRIYAMTAGEQLTIQMWGTLDVSTDNQVTLTVEEIR
jgi:hypothetical protein